MAFSSYRKIFKGTLDKKNIEDLNKLDYNFEKLKDRKRYLEEKYRNSVIPFYERYIGDGYYKVALSKDDELSAEINVFKAIERDGSYLINSLDIPRDSQYKYNLLSQEEFDNLLSKEKKEDITDESFQNILLPNLKNVYTNLDLKITQKDLNENSEMGSILRDYQRAKIHLNEENKKIKAKEPSYLNLGKIKLLVGTINCDMLDVKKRYKGMTTPNSSCGGHGEFDFNSIDYTNVNHIKAIIKNIRFGELHPDSPLSHIAYDIEKAIKELLKNGKIDDLDFEIIDCINSGMSNTATAREVKRDESTVRSRLDKVSKRIAIYYKE